MNKEFDKPIQILICVTYPIYCVLRGLAIWLEHHLAAGKDAGCQFLFGIEVLSEAKKINDQA